MRGTVFFFCYFAWGHTVPMYPMMRELVRRGFSVRVYTTSEFAAAVQETGSTPVVCDEAFAAAAQDQRAYRDLRPTDPLKTVTARTPLTYLYLAKRMDGLVARDVSTFAPVFAMVDSNATWGKLLCLKHDIPYVESSGRIPFNMFSMLEYDQFTFRLMEPVIAELDGLLGDMARDGFPERSYLSLWLTEYETDCVFYQESFMLPCAETYHKNHMFFAGRVGRETGTGGERGRLGLALHKERPLVFVTMGTVSSKNLGFWRACIEAFAEMDIDVVMIVWRDIEIESLGRLPSSIVVLKEGDQREYLPFADVCVCQGGMGTLSDALWSGVPMVLFPKVFDQYANARLVVEQGAGISALSQEPQEIRTAVQTLLERPCFRQEARRLGTLMRASAGPAEAIEWVLGQKGW